MRREEAMPSPFVRATMDGLLNLPGSPESIVVTLTGTVRTHTFDDGKPQRVVSFKEIAGKELGLNGTNWDSIARISGQGDDEEWAGVVVELFVVPESKSKTGHAVRIRKPRGAAYPAKPLVQQAADAFGAAPPNSIGTGAVALRERLKAISHSEPTLRQWLVYKGVEPSSLIAADPELWPMTWVPTIKDFLTDPAKSMGLVRASLPPATITEDDIPF